MGLLDVLQLKKPQGGANGTVEVGFGDDSIGVQTSDDGTTITLKHEKKFNVARETFQAWVIPFFLKIDLKVAIQGQLKIGDKSPPPVGFSAAGALEVGPGTSNV